MRRVALTLTMLAGLAALTPTIPSVAETRRALEAEARQNGAPMAWIRDGTFMMGSQDGSRRGTRRFTECICMRSLWTSMR